MNAEWITSFLSPFVLSNGLEIMKIAAIFSRYSYRTIRIVTDKRWLVSHGASIRGEEIDRAASRSASEANERLQSTPSRAAAGEIAYQKRSYNQTSVQYTIHAKWRKVASNVVSGKQFCNHKHFLNFTLFYESRYNSRFSINDKINMLLHR